MCSLPSVWHSSFLKRKKRKRERKPAEARLRRIRVAAVGWRMHCFLASLRSWSTLLSCCEIVPVTQSVCALLPRSITHPSKLGRRHLAAAAFRLEVLLLLLLAAAPAYAAIGSGPLRPVALVSRLAIAVVFLALFSVSRIRPSIELAGQSTCPSTLLQQAHPSCLHRSTSFVSLLRHISLFSSIHLSHRQVDSVSSASSVSSRSTRTVSLRTKGDISVRPTWHDRPAHRFPALVYRITGRKRTIP